MLRAATAIALLALPLAACGPIAIPAPWEDTDPADPAPRAANLQPGPPNWSRLAPSIRGKPIQAATLGTGPFRVYVIGGIAGDEPEGPAAAERLVPELYRTLPPTLTVRVVRDMNPDGTAARTRGNTRGIDLTRNWPKDHIAGPRHGPRPVSELETAAIEKDLGAFKPSLVVVFRSSARGPSASLSGPGPFLASPFVTAARGIDPRWRAIPERRAAESGTPEAYIAARLGTPVLIIEFQRGRDPVTNAAAARAGIIAAAERAAPPATAPPPPPAQAQAGW